VVKLARSLRLRPQRDAATSDEASAARQRARRQAREQPPECPEGWQIGPPDFVIMGAEKAGTSRWLRLMQSHPDVYHEAAASELHFFDGFADRWPTADDIHRYHQYFPRPTGGVTGEKTPMYLTLFWVARMLAQAAPDARIIVLLRDPVERFLSGRAHAEQYREESLATGTTDAGFTRRAVETAFQRGLYSIQLAWILDAFPREQVLAIQYEACNADPLGQLARTFAFIGLPDHTPDDSLVGKQINPSKVERQPIEPERRELIARLYQRDVLRLREMVPDLDLGRWPNFRHLA
jgi:hypothetical protein